MERGGQIEAKFYDIHRLTEAELPVRTDSGGTAVDYLEPPTRRRKEPWERLSKQRIAELLVEAQSTDDGMAICAGCGRELEREFMELDHIQPRKGGGTNDITNRILLCGPCNGRKSARYTLPGLQDENRKTKWMRDKRKAQIAQENARRMAEKVRKGEIR